MNEATMAKRTSKLFSVLVLSIFILSMTITAFGAVKKDPRYSQQTHKDFNTDAPWRVQNADTPIPFVFAIHDVHLNDLNELWTCKIWITDAAQNNPVLIYSHDFNELLINTNTPDAIVNGNEYVVINGNWEFNVTKFELNNLEDPKSPYSSLNGKEITAANLITAANPLFKTGDPIDPIYFKTEIAGEDELGKDVKFSKYLKVVVGEPLPKPLKNHYVGDILLHVVDENWYYGDTHYHTEYTDNDYEYGGTLKSTKNAIKAMGLDWVTTTDHASDHADNYYWFLKWDLSIEAFANLKDRVNLLNINGLPFLVGEEVTVTTGKNATVSDQQHLLVYNNSEFISGAIDGKAHPDFDLASRLDLVIGESFAFAAHPTYPEDDLLGSGSYISDMVEWTDENYTTALGGKLENGTVIPGYDRFRGLEVWNGRDAYKTTNIDDNDVNPFINTNGTWGEPNSKWYEKLEKGIDKWDELLFNQLLNKLGTSSPFRKIFIEGGSDAHGDFNYFTFGPLGNITGANDNALGKVRTLVYAPEGKTGTNILDGLKDGHSVVTDGPVCIFGIDKNADGDLTKADIIIGDNTDLTSGQKLEFLIKWQSTKEFGSIYKLIIYRGSAESAKPEKETSDIIGDSYRNNGFPWKDDGNMSAIRNGMTYYYRIEVRSRTSSEEYRCLTNPIWVSWNNTTPDPNTAFQPIPDTGISKCYNDTAVIPCPTAGQDFYGQDANYSINPMSYTKLDSTGKDLPITATTWAMVKDNVTGLIWENNSHFSTWNDAPTVIANLNTSKFGGYSDWRLPTMTELGSIVDFSVPYPGPTINTNYFKDTFASFYWSSSTNAIYVNVAWGVDFYYGGDGGNYDKDGAYYVRAVRAGQLVIGSFDPLVINGDRIVSDNTTGLMWQQDTAKTATGGTTMVWKDALSYCENLTLGGYTDWRLPTVKELRSIVDYTVCSPAIDTSVFKDTFASFYWSSSAYAGYVNYAWGVDFNYGNGPSYRKSNADYVRAVRAGQLVIGSFGHLTISPTNKSVSNSAGTTTFAVSNTDTAASTMAWSASVTSGGDWLSITSGSSGSNSGTITCSYSANTTTSARTGTIRVTANGATGSPQDLTVVQASGGSKPTVQTGAVGAVATNSATLNGTINPNGTSTTYYFQYGTTTSYGKVTPAGDAGSGTTVKSVSANITGLTANTLYHVQLVGTNTAGTVYGGDKTFTTTASSITKPVVTTGSASLITENSVKLSGTVTPKGASTTYYFEYGATTAYGKKTAILNAGSGTASVSVNANLVGFSAGTTYYFRLVATNSAGTAYGVNKTFTTTKPATVLKPTVTTEAATSITATLAKLNGTVNPNGDITSYYFQYGLTTSYGSTTRSPRSGSERASFSVYNTITGLTKNTTYHFRIVAINSAGTTYGLDKTFTTLP